MQGQQVLQQHPQQWTTKTFDGWTFQYHQVLPEAPIFDWHFGLYEQPGVAVASATAHLFVHTRTMVGVVWAV